MRISVLASGSAGNLVLFQTARTRVLIDAGLGPREYQRRLVQLGGGEDERLPDAIFITHEHDDHVRAASAYADLGVPVHATPGTRKAMGMQNHPVREIRPAQPQVVGDLEIRAVKLPHDAREPVGYVVSDGLSRAGVLTDCGTDDAEVARGFAGVDLLVLEFNHDAMLLKAGPYPGWLKRRIASDRGHLSNQQSVSLLRRIARESQLPRTLVLAHLSQVNNRPGIAYHAALEVMPRRGSVVVASQAEPTPWLDPAAAPGKSPAGLRGEQLVLRLVSG